MAEVYFHGNQYDSTTTNGTGFYSVGAGQSVAFARNRWHWTEGPGSQPITWISEEPPPTDPDTVMRRVEALRSGENQWGHDGAHHGRQGDPDCPMYLHHHHDFKCAMPTVRECEMAGVEYRTRWASRG